MTFQPKPLSCDPVRVRGMSERLIVSHYENNYCGAVKRLNLIQEQLAGLDARRVWDELHQLTGGAEPILLCFERRQCDCHRGLVASWLCEELGHAVDEFDPTGHAGPDLFSGL